MNVAQQLDMLQELDLELDHLHQQLTSAQAGLGPTAELEAAGAALRASEAGMEAKRAVVQEREWDARQGQEKIAPLEAKLYSGRVTNAKELANMQRDLDSLKAHQRVLDERLLEAMIAVEEVQDRVRAANGHLAQVTQSWQAEQDRLRREAATLQAEMATLLARRQAESAAIDAKSLSTYQHLRPGKGGRAVAHLVGSICQGCHITLPSGDAVRVKTSSELVFCINCGRILCTGGISHK